PAFRWTARASAARYPVRSLQVSERASQARIGVAQPALDRLLRRAVQTCDLGKRKSSFDVQQERIPLRFRQGPARRDDPLSTLRIGGHALRIVAVWPGMGIEVERLETLRRAGSPLVDQAIARDGVEPRRESRSRLVTRACRDQFH